MYDYDDYEGLDERGAHQRVPDAQRGHGLAVYRKEHAVRAAQLGGIEGVPGGEAVEGD